MSNSVWNRDDCIHQVLGDIDRPEWLRTATSVEAVANFKREFDGDIEKGCQWFADQFGDHQRIANDAELQPGDVVVGKTFEYDFAIAKVHASYLPIIRTEIGFDAAKFTEIIGVWRPK